MELKEGMYVRTTYGIGKITQSYIVYDDSGYLWHLAYMTDNPKIQIAIYTKEFSWELFGEVQKDHGIKYEPIKNNLNLVNEVYKKELDDVVCYVPVDNNYPRNAELFDDHKFIKASYNIIDLIEVGDYVNGEQVRYIEEGTDYRVLAIDEDYTYIIAGYDCDGFTKPIKSIVTKEMFANAEYKVETN